MEFSDLLKNPEAFGFCTFEEFRKNKDKWRFSPEQLFESVQNADLGLKKRVKRIRYKVKGHTCNSLEQVQRIAREEGMDLRRLDIWPEVIDVGGQWCDILVTFMDKDIIQARMAEIARKKAEAAEITPIA